MYLIDINNGQDTVRADSYKEAVEFAHTLEAKEHPESIEIIRSTDATLCWTNKDSAALRQYTELDAEQWLNLDKGMKEESDKPSIYFDIDGTLGYFYQDARGMVYPDEVLDPKTHYFRDIEPHPFIIDLAKNLTEKGYDVCVISAADKDTIRDKYEWLKENCGFIKDENICFCPLGADKTEFVKGNAEKSILVDDYPKNLSEWKGIPVKAVNSINSYDRDMLCINGYAIESDESRAGEWASLIDEMTENITLSLEDSLYVKTVDRHEFKLDGKPMKLDTAQISENDYETMLIDESGESYEEEHTYSYENAIAVHELIAARYEIKKEVTDFKRIMSHRNIFEEQEQQPSNITIPSVENAREARLRDELEEILPQIAREANFNSTTLEITSASYDDKVSSNTILKAYNDYCDYGMKDGYASFETFLEDRLLEDFLNDTISYEYDALFNEIMEMLPEHLADTFDDYVKDVGMEGVIDKAGIEVNVDTYSYIGECHINLMFATATEQNYDCDTISRTFPSDFSNIYMANGDDKVKYRGEMFDNALSYVIHQQGHTISEVYDALYTDNESDNNFIKSVADEISGMSYDMSNVTALTSVGGEDLVKLLDSIANKHKEEYITLPTNTEIGLYNEWNGSGSALEIALEKPLIIPVDMVRNVQFERTDSRDYIERNANNGYTVDDTYGLVHSVWTKSSPKLSWDEPSVIKEDILSLSAKYEYYHAVTNENHFFDDVDKMQDIQILSKDEFLESYSYLKSRDYDETLAVVNYEADKLAYTVLAAYENTDEAGEWTIESIRDRLSDIHLSVKEATAFYNDIADYRDSFKYELSHKELDNMGAVLKDIDKFQMSISNTMIEPSNYTVDERIELASNNRCLIQLVNDSDEGVKKVANENMSKSPWVMDKEFKENDLNKSKTENKKFDRTDD